MTQQPPPKKSRSRDISALKERLRPKTGSNAPVGGRAPGASGGTVLPPPGLDVPPPPGVATGPAAPAAPVHDAHDPFGAMNALAQAGAAQRAPEIVIVHDGKPVESVSTGHRAATIAKYAAIALVPFVVGIAIRGISKDAAAYNSGISGARFILSDVRNLKKSLAGLKDKLDESAKKDLSGRDVTAALAGFDKLELKDDLVYKAKQNSLGALISGQVLGFYGAATELKQMIADHLKWAKNDDAALGVALEATKKLPLPKELAQLQVAGKYRYAVMLWNPTPEEQRTDTAEPGARLVEIGPPFCGTSDKPSTTGSCPAESPVSTLAIRYSPGGNWIRGDFAMLSPGEPVASRKIIPMSSNDLFQALAMSPQGAAAELAYRKRLQHIVEKLAETVELGNKLEDKLKTKANEKTHFTFFM